MALVVSPLTVPAIGGFEVGRGLPMNGTVPAPLIRRGNCPGISAYYARGKRSVVGRDTYPVMRGYHYTMGGDGHA